MDKKMMKGLRKLAQPLKAKIQVGKGGFNDPTANSLEEALKANELIKVHVLNNAPEDVDVVAEQMAAKANAHLISVTGRMVVLYRENKEKAQVKHWIEL